MIEHSVTISDVMTDPDLFGEQFSGQSWQAWRVLLAGFYGLPIDDIRTWKSLTRRNEAPGGPFEELWLVVGRRGGKSQIAALLAIFEAFFRDYKHKLAPGEVATVMVLAADRKQARSCFRYISGLLHSNQMLEALIVREDKESIELSNRVVIEVGTASFRAVRGYSVACVIADEIAFWRSEESANPDAEILNALRPAMATLGGKLIGLSSPYAKKGVLYDNYRRFFGKDEERQVLVAQAPSRTMNPSLPQKIVDRAMEQDRPAAQAEYLAQFRNDLEAFVRREVVERCMFPGRYELPPLREHRYHAFVDPSGGSVDSMTLAIGHREKNICVVDAIREVRPPFAPDAVVQGFCELMKSYRINSVTGDKYAGEWPRERFKEHGVEYLPAAKPRSELYQALLPQLNSGTIELLDNDKVLLQLCNLERRTSRAGRDLIDHGQGGHDDVANAVAGLAAQQKPAYHDYALLI
jgi:rhodanese-related sulfurtransferase